MYLQQKKTTSFTTELDVSKPNKADVVAIKQRQKPWKGVFWKVFACLCFALINGTVRYINGGAGNFQAPLSPYQIVFLQNVVGFLFMVPWIIKSGTKRLKTSMPALHLIRVITAVAGVLLWYFSLYYMPMAKAIALAFTGPIFTILGAHFYLKEKIGLPRYLGIGLSIVGAFIITRPDRILLSPSVDFNLSCILPLLSAIAITASKLTGRELAVRGESAANMTTYLLFLMIPVSCLPAFFNWTPLTMAQWPWLLLLGALATAAHFSLAKAFTLSEVSFLSPFGLSRMLFSALIGYFAFMEIPSTSVWSGGIIILLAALFMSWDSIETIKKQRGSSHSN